MGRHSRVEEPDEEPPPGSAASWDPYAGVPADPSFQAFSGPTDDRVYVSPHERVRFGSPPDAGPRRGEPLGYRFEPLPGDCPGDVPGVSGPDRPPEQPRVLSEETRAGPPRDRPGDGSGAGPPGPGSARGRSLPKFLSGLPFPLLPIVALVIAVGIVSYALSTQQISLNFAGGAPQDSLGQHDNQVFQRDQGDRAGRGTDRADGLVVAFSVTSRSADGFKATATVANKGGEPVRKWALAFRFPQATVTAVSGATVVRTGEVAFVRGVAPLAPGDTVRIAFAADGTATRPSSCVLNRQPCALA